MIHFILFLLSNTVAGNFIIHHPCEKSPILNSNYSFESNNVLDLTKKLISKNSIPSELADNGVKSILNYVTGDDALEIISDTKMRAYGWCYSVNGISPDVMPDEFSIEQNDQVDWFLSYSTYDSGVWIDYCKPVHLNPESQKHICPK